MGGRGASSGVGNNGKPYGSEYRTLFQTGNIKFVERRDNKSTTAPIETRSENRVYVTVRKDNGQMHSISIMRAGKVRTQIDYQDHYGLGPHTHEWTYPGTKVVRGKPRSMTAEERKLFDRVNEEYRKFRSGS
ncbi:hypothetical protein Uis1B_0555 [Bifidobacterium margollesii]|uniref:Uncharacterized protein n=1 Tax=Bifidobacterium margollesii TaxID=2020964 RepID=A0A2N5JBI2_9BIFI|nr:hypothetical protein [Bifidobacterium margollesii]PLS31564.1 hypothetical protein Uis1B_0555 [Bifidobacterium margollesii]